MKSSNPSWGHMTGVTRLPCQSQIKHEFPPHYFSNSLSMGWTLCRYPCSLWDSTVFFPGLLPLWRLSASKSHSRKCGAPLPIAGLSPKTVSPRITERRKERKTRRKRRKRRSGRAVMSKCSQTPRMDNQIVGSPLK